MLTAVLDWLFHNKLSLENIIGRIDEVIKYA